MADGGRVARSGAPGDGDPVVRYVLLCEQAVHLGMHFTLARELDSRVVFPGHHAPCDVGSGENVPGLVTVCFVFEDQLPILGIFVEHLWWPGDNGYDLVGGYIVGLLVVQIYGVPRRDQICT